MLKNRKWLMVFTTILTLVLIFFQSTYIRAFFDDSYKIKAEETKEKKIDTAQKTSDFSLPYLVDDPSDRGNPLMSYSKTITLGQESIPPLEGKYSFIPRWTDSIPGRPDTGTKMVNVNNSFTELASHNAFQGPVYRYTPEDAKAGKVAQLIYTNVGIFKGKWIDMRVTVNKVDEGAGFNTRFERAPGLLIGANKHNFNQVRLTLGLGTKEADYPSADLQYDYLDHETQAKVEVTGYNVFSDVDFYESILLNEKQMNLQKLIVQQTNILNYKITNQLLHIFPARPGVGEPDATDPNYDRETSKRSWAAYTFGPTSSYNLIFRMSNSASLVDNEALIPFKTDNPNKLGYDSTDKVDFSIYQYTPNNGKNYRYKSFIWLDPIHNAVKIADKSDITLKLGQTQQELPQSYYNVTIDRDKTVPSVSADPEIGIEAEPAGVRDVIRVEFTEQFMQDQAMYGEMLQMDIKGTLNKDNLTAVREVYSEAEQAFIIPNRSELHYTDTILTDNENKKNVVSSNTAKSRVKSTEAVQPFVSKKVTNKTAVNSNRPTGTQAKIGDILEYEMEIENRSFVPTNVWKNVDISDTVVSSLDVDASTISVIQDNKTVAHVYDADSQKISLPKKNILADDKANFKIKFSAKINLSGAATQIDNWVFAKGFDSANKAVNGEANALLKEFVENLVPPTITLNEKTGVSTGEAKKLTGTFKDSDSDTVSIYYKIDDKDPVQIIADYPNAPKNTSIPYEFMIPAAELPQGAHKIEVYAVDKEGLISNKETLELTDGILQLLSAPKIIVFGTNIAVKASDQRIDEPESMDKDLIISDQRGSKKDWVLKAKLTEELHNAADTSIVIEDAIRYVYKNKEFSLNSNAQNIYQPDKQVSLYNVNATWTKKGDGLKLETKSGAIKKTGDYEAKILWQLVEAPSSSKP
ncbi:WxL domain-containing protein [Candidatus Enterococcus ikei]|uniref:WxL domain-containing protein n=1 Tax=Candidatus Enterococcus ikei TaxID=2815326 RepID=A0ABS3H0X5_9ENTE|nr:WxL domain-containing protein [Enterococcus sp. DIV0869a]MBO0441176.1 WxL domain-containing protein [Enterococcus sp. DIV0869a]